MDAETQKKFNSGMQTPVREKASGLWDRMVKSIYKNESTQAAPKPKPSPSQQGDGE